MDVVPAFVYAGGGPIHVGMCDPDYEGKTGKFDTFGAIYYPSRRFVSQFVRSKYMLKTIQNKNPGDGLVSAFSLCLFLAAVLIALFCTFFHAFLQVVATVPYVWP